MSHFPNRITVERGALTRITEQQRPVTNVVDHPRGPLGEAIELAQGPLLEDPPAGIASLAQAFAHVFRHLGLVEGT